ncbi:putative catabolite repression protein creC isoform X2 [Silene latifolia]|uniref:putative catabolite repression protein creC isoform X2 n=1 Tax=Silene latifolia TaxID=37657 RepID=UPI003D786E3E
MMNNGLMNPLTSTSSSNSISTTGGAATTGNNNHNHNNNQSTNTLKTYFKTPEGRYKLQYEKSHPSGLLHFSHGKTISQVTLAHLKEKTQSPQASTSGAGVASGVRSAAARILGAGNGRALSFVGGNGGSKYANGSIKNGSVGISSTNSTNGCSNFDGKGTYLVFNVGDTIFISDLNSQDKDPVKSIHFGNSNPLCHAFDPDAKDGHDLLIGLTSGDVYSVSLRQQLQDLGKKLVGTHHYNKDGSINNSRCTSVAWVPKGDGTFVVAHADGNVYVYEKSKDGVADSTFSAIKDQTQFSVSHARHKSNPIARWHICQGSINCITFSNDGAYMATVGRDGYLRVYDYKREQLICGGKSYYGALLCCAWSGDSKYILTGGEDDLVQVWSMEDRKVVAWGEGHNSWVSGVAFDPYWAPPNSDDTGENVVYRFGSVGQDTQLLLWDLEMNEIVVPLRRAPGGSPLGGSPTYSTASQSSHWDNIGPVGTLQPSPSMRDVPKLNPVVTHRVHTEPLSGVLFTQDSILTACREGHIKVWMRPGCVENQASNSEMNPSIGSREKSSIIANNGISGSKH